MTEFTKTASVKWKAMGDAEKAPYDSRALADKQRYEAQMQMYVPAPGFSSKGSRKRVSSFKYGSSKKKFNTYNFFIVTSKLISIICWFLQKGQIW